MGEEPEGRGEAAGAGERGVRGFCWEEETREEVEGVERGAPLGCAVTEAGAAPPTSPPPAPWLKSKEVDDISGTGGEGRREREGDVQTLRRSIGYRRRVDVKQGEEAGGERQSRCVVQTSRWRATGDEM